jgi:hypothetical protein
MHVRAIATSKKISLHAKFFCLSAMPSVFGCCMQNSKPNFLCRHHLLQDAIAYLSQQGASLALQDIPASSLPHLSFSDSW